ncbi:hypothetical protein ON010_g7637 [Phytophthora cinnamomi]|nr:hypothetical protein ON010_g7637 [Phytophthora cinnamomi]
MLTPDIDAVMPADTEQGALSVVLAPTATAELDEMLAFSSTDTLAPMAIRNSTTRSAHSSNTAHQLGGRRRRTEHHLGRVKHLQSSWQYSPLRPGYAYATHLPSGFVVTVSVVSVTSVVSIELTSPNVVLERVALTAEPITTAAPTAPMTTPVTLLLSREASEDVTVVSVVSGTCKV